MSESETTVTLLVQRNRREKMKNIFSNFVDPSDWWFWLLIPITGPLWLIGEILALLGIG